MLGFQAAGAAPIVEDRIVAKPKTIATAIRIGNPASWKAAVAARDESNGLIHAVTDAEILEAYRLLAVSAGVFVEPASAAPVAGILKLARSGYFAGHQGGRIVCTVTGHGLKDPGTAMKDLPQPQVVAANRKAIVSLIGL